MGGDVVHAEVAGEQQVQGAVPHVDLQAGDVAEVFEVVGGKGVPQDVGRPLFEAGGEPQGTPAFFPAERDDGGSGRAEGGDAQQPAEEDAPHDDLPPGCGFGLEGGYHDDALAEADVAPAESRDFGGAQARPEHEAECCGAGAVFGALRGGQESAYFEDGEGADALLGGVEVGELFNGVGATDAQPAAAGEDGVQEGAGFALHGHGFEACFDEVDAVGSGDFAHGHVAPPRFDPQHALDVLGDFLQGARATARAAAQGDFKEFPEGPIPRLEFVDGAQHFAAAEDEGMLDELAVSGGRVLRLSASGIGGCRR